MLFMFYHVGQKPILQENTDMDLSKNRQWVHIFFMICFKRSKLLSTIYKGKSKNKKCYTLIML